MKLSTPTRLVIAVLMVYVLIRLEPTPAAMRGFMFGCLYFLGGLVAASLALSIVERTITAAGEHWAARTFDACGVLHVDGRPCMLPDGHRHLEHATVWTDAPTLEGEVRIETRHRFDDTGDRVERRIARGQLPKVTRGGEVAAAPVSTT